jgi:hypothetical protein
MILSLLSPCEDLQWTSIDKFCELKKVDKAYKTQAQRRKYIEKTLNIQLQPDDNGELGVMIHKGEEGIKNVKRGRRIAVSKVKEQEFESKLELKEAQTKAAQALEVASVTQARHLSAKQSRVVSLPYFANHTHNHIHVSHLPAYATSSCMLHYISYIIDVNMFRHSLTKLTVCIS